MVISQVHKGERQSAPCTGHQPLNVVIMKHSNHIHVKDTVFYDQTLAGPPAGVGLKNKRICFLIIFIFCAAHYYIVTLYYYNNSFLTEL